MMIFRHCELIFILLAASQVFPSGFSLDSLIHLGLRNNPELEAARQEAVVAAQDTLTARVLSNPTLSLEALHNLSDVAKPKTGVRLSQEFRPGLRSKQFEVARANWSAKLARQKAREWDLTTDIRTAYFSWQILNRKRAIQKEVKDRWEGLARLATAKVAEGRISQVEEAQAQLNAAKAGQRELDFQTELDAIGKRLDFRTGKSGIGDSITQIKLDSFPSIPSVDSLKTWIKYSNPDLQALDLETASLDRQLVLEKSLKRQSFSLTLGFDRESDGTNLIGGGVVLPLPLFNRNQAGIAKSTASRQEAVLLRSAAEKKFAADIEESQGRLINLSTRYRNYSEHIRTLSQKQLSLSEKGFKQGLLGIFDLSRVQEEALAQDMEALDIVDQFYQQWIRLGRVVGEKLW